MRMTIPALVMLTTVAGCVSSPPASGPVDRLRPLAAAHAEALAGEDAGVMLRTGRSLLAGLSAYAGWR